MRYAALTLCLCLLLCGCQSFGAAEISDSTVLATLSPASAPVTAESTGPSSTAAETTTVAAIEETVPAFDPYTLTRDMSLEELVGQIFLARCPEENAALDIAEYHLGGFVLFGRDFESETPDSVRAKIQQYQERSNIPMLIAVDEEGGTVTRVSSFTQFRASPFPSPRSLFDQGGLDLVLRTEAEKCQLLHSLGINVNLAPVCDVTTEPTSFMYKRSLGQSPAITGAFAAEACRLMQERQIGSVLKHFPGYGNNTDTHTGIAVDTRTLDALESCDLVPFRAGIAADCGGVLVSHTIVECLDSTRPASLSSDVIMYLRRNLGFDGVIMTDDLVMEAITDLYGAGESAVLAVLAGNDMLCSSEYQIQYAAVLEAAQSGRISREQLVQSAGRILQWKYKLGLLTP